MHAVEFEGFAALRKETPLSLSRQSVSRHRHREVKEEPAKFHLPYFHWPGANDEFCCRMEAHPVTSTVSTFPT